MESDGHIYQTRLVEILEKTDSWRVGDQVELGQENFQKAWSTGASKNSLCAPPIVNIDQADLCQREEISTSILRPFSVLWSITQ